MSTFTYFTYMMCLNLVTHQMRKTPPYSPITIAMRVATMAISLITSPGKLTRQRNVFLTDRNSETETRPEVGGDFRCQRLESHSLKKYSTLEIQHCGSRKWGLEVFGFVSNEATIELRYDLILSGIVWQAVMRVPGSKRGFHVEIRVGICRDVSGLTHR